MTKKIAILGSTGSIGKQTLEVIAHHPDQFTIEALAAGSNITLVIEQAQRFQPRIISVANQQFADEIKPFIPKGSKVVFGEEGLIEAAAGTDAELVVTAIMGSIGLKPTLAAIQAGKHIGIANKETLVTAGHLVTNMAKKSGVHLLPIDSEHSALFQCLNGEKLDTIRRIIITASGGSFRDKSREELVGVTVEQALNHPNWSMGAKITIDSATMVNKGLEVIEAHWLFQLDYDQIEVVLHPESIIHSIVEFVDYSMIAQMGNPDMRVPIQYALTYPSRLPSPSQPLDLVKAAKLHFNEMDIVRYPLMGLAFDCGKLGGTATTVFNAANESTVAAFLSGQITFLDIETVLFHVVDQHELVANPDLEQIVEADQWARKMVNQIVKKQIIG